MFANKYATPVIELLEIKIEQCLCLSHTTPDINVGIGGWEVENEDYNIK